MGCNCGGGRRRASAAGARAARPTIGDPNGMVWSVRCPDGSVTEFDDPAAMNVAAAESGCAPFARPA